MLPEPIAPDFHVRYGISGGYNSFLDDPERWDPLGIGVEDAMTLLGHIRKDVAGVTDEMYAQGYLLRVEIAESHLTRRDEIISEIITIIQESREHRNDNDNSAS